MFEIIKRKKFTPEREIDEICSEFLDFCFVKFDNRNLRRF